MMIWMLRRMKKRLSNNFHLVLGIVIGLFLHGFFVYFSFGGPSPEIEHPKFKHMKVDVFKRQVNATKVNVTLLPRHDGGGKIVRPRYYSTELGIREKLFVGVFTSEEKIVSHSYYINETLHHLVDRVKYFITAQKKFKYQFNLSGIVGFTDTRLKFRPFQVVKYVGDTFGRDYDFYFFMNDYNYLNARDLSDVLTKISVREDVYMGTLVEDGSYCDLNYGILISNSVLKAMRENLDWCVSNAISDDHGENIGRCIYHSIGLNCQQSVQGQVVTGFKMKHFSLRDKLPVLSKNPKFQKAIVIYPVLETNDIFYLHMYYSTRKLQKYKWHINWLSVNLTESWPPGIKPGTKPATRFDLPKTYYFNATHVFFPDDFKNVAEHSKAEARDLDIVLNTVNAYVRKKSPLLKFKRLINGYRSFDLSRGVDYKLDLSYIDSTTYTETKIGEQNNAIDQTNDREIIKRFEISKPLGKVEFVPVPYVTENSRVILILPLEEEDVAEAQTFLMSYKLNVMEKKEKAILMMGLLYRNESPSKGEMDPFGKLKTFAVKVSDRYRNEDIKILWISIRLPPNPHASLETQPALNFGIIDLALKKIGLETIIFIVDPYVELRAEFLNRVRMNTIVNYQIFSPIPFRLYNPKISKVETVEVQKDTGHYDREEYKFISFYGRDYVEARKTTIRDFVPIVRSDSDIVNLLSHPRRKEGNVFKMFLESGAKLHCMRATDSSFLLRYKQLNAARDRSRLFLGNKAQIAGYLLENDSEFKKMADL